MAISTIKNQPTTEQKPERVYDIDWLRVLAVLLLIPFHTALIFGSGQADHWLKDQPTLASDLFAHFTHQWHMPLLFLLSGMATWFALGFRTPGQYQVERFKRLLVPLVLLLLFYPWQAYCWFLINTDFQGSFFQFYPIPFVAIADFGLSAVWGHLWFLVYLFVFSLVSLPLLLYFRSEAGRPFISKLAALAEKSWAIFLLAIPLALIEMAFRARWGNTRNLYGDWANFFSYLTLFVYGYLLTADPRFRRAIARHTWIALGLGVMTFLVGLTWLLGGYPNEYAAHNNLSVGWFLYMALRGFNAWFWLMAVLGLGQKYLNTNSTARQYLNEAALPIYILHMPLNVIVGFYVLSWDIGLLAKFLIISLGTFVASFLIYDLLVKRTNVTRVLFGMKPKERTAARLMRQPA